MMTRVVRVDEKLYQQIKIMKTKMKTRKPGRPPSLWNSDLNDWDIKLVYNPKKRKIVTKK